ncbi:MAG: leucine-rich repeat domain-containing protein [Mycoplasma sp.]
MKLKTLFKCLGGLAVSSSLIPVGMSFNNKALSLSLSNQNVGNLEQNNEIEWDIDSSGLISPHDKAQVKGDIVIPAKVGNKTVTGIKNGAFVSCNSLKSITIPNSAKIIETGSFFGCISLVSVNISNGLTSIGNQAFEECWSLASITIPNSVTTISYRTFTNDKNLTDIYLNWNDDQLETVKKNSSKNDHYGILEGIFTLDNDGKLTNNTNSNIKVHLPKETSNDLLRKYQKYFGALEDIGNDKYNWGGLALQDNQWLRDIEPNGNTNILAPILGGVFGGITLIGLIVGSFIFIKKKRNS